jgi:hypothetical protein
VPDVRDDGVEDGGKGSEEGLGGVEVGGGNGPGGHAPGYAEGWGRYYLSILR